LLQHTFSYKLSIMNYSGKSLCVFCGSSYGNDKEYADKAFELGCYLAKKGITLVFGGGRVGLMGKIAEGVIEYNGHVKGIIPKRIYDMVKPVNLEDLEIVNDMHSRKARMYELSDAFLALPGGIGTIEEIFETYTWLQLGFHLKPVGILNTHGFYDTLIEFLDNMVAQGFLKTAHKENLIISNNVEAIVDRLLSHSPEYIEKLKD